MSWFRMHDEFVDDPKVQRLSPEFFKFWMNCLGLASQNDGQLPSIPDICWKLKLSSKKVAAAIAHLNESGLLDQDGQSFAPHNWAARQYKSDLSTDRVKRFRAVSRNGKPALPKQEDDVAETAPEAEAEQSRADTDRADATKEALERIAAEIKERHPPLRSDLTVEGVKTKLRSIVKYKKTHKPEWIALWEKINANHREVCASYDWTKENGTWAKGLEKWLAPTMGRYDVGTGDAAPQSSRPHPAMIL